jgi:hypothetical protein
MGDILIYTDTDASGAGGTVTIDIQPPAQEEWELQHLIAYNDEGGVAQKAFFYDGTNSVPIATSESPNANEEVLYMAWGLQEANEVAGNRINIDNNTYLRLQCYSMAAAKNFYVRCVYRIKNNY